MTAAPRPTVEHCLAAAAARLRAAGVEDARREARLLLGRALGRPVQWLVAHPGEALPVTAAFDALIDRRAAREPLSHILGEREFWSLSFAVGPQVLDPRPDSETLVEASLEAFPDREAPLRVVDLGTGSGCLLLAVLSERPAARGVGVDLSQAALATARRNAGRLGLAGRALFVCGDWAGAVAGGVDLVLANPPYIPSAEIPGLAPEVARCEPETALDGGPDGLDAYRALAPRLPAILAPGGLALVEVGAGQAGAVSSILAAAGLDIGPPRSDLGGVPRCVPGGARHRATREKTLGKDSVTV